MVLRQHKLGEADRIVTLLTRDHGLVRAVAKGVRRTRSKFGARLEPFAHIPLVTAGAFTPVPLLCLLAIDIALIALGLAAFRRRDVQN